MPRNVTEITGLGNYSSCVLILSTALTFTKDRDAL
jgi:hypothetical protein